MSGTEGQASTLEDDLASVRREVDVIALGIVAAAILMFVAIGAEIGPDVIASLRHGTAGPDPFILNAFLLNIAIIIFGWSRYRDLCREIHACTVAETKARRLAETDPLTGFLNRRSFNEMVGARLEEAPQRGRTVALMMIDIDNFKQINDYNGHQTGDQLLLEAARRIRGCVPQDAALGRIGGDEFAVAFTFEPGRPEKVAQIATSLVATFNRSVPINGLELKITASVGIARADAALAEGKSADARSLLDMADIAMYHVKRQGRNNWSWFEEPMASEMRYRAQLESGIRQGIANGEFVPYYEQQVDLQTGEVTGFEMLARWQSPTLGLVSPEVFIPIAEEIGAISDLSEQVIGRALEDAKGWDPSLTLAVNISPLQLRDPWFAQKLLKLLVEASFPGHRLEIEITESCLHQNVAQVRSLIASLKNQGIKISLDDFGTGYSSLAQLRTLPFDRIKIDRSFVTNLVDSTDSAAIVHAIALLGRGLNLPITAEGIESGAILDHLRQYGEIKGQGFFYGRPVPAADLQDWLDRHGKSLSAVTGDVAIAPEAVAEPEAVAATPSREGTRRVRQA
ncbi:putative bifunctional diguanylate cyclase/phosphodiesterase [Novosphingobium colocasiae]|uniref:EAL domain-containing protein n=1 Tax=Novosphingobium colocasiae TaxID=1256513 RepID=A0A918PBA1_9SPHN|nr:EAL domain-containing protein [Novosphingobium colocasiae]GGY95489.1 hypothetical protein GCM10011614_07740 [Novosphingobium colocasiae]